jgi:hypothetical protein
LNKFKIYHAYKYFASPILDISDEYKSGLYKFIFNNGIFKTNIHESDDVYYYAYSYAYSYIYIIYFYSFGIMEYKSNSIVL